MPTLSPAKKDGPRAGGVDQVVEYLLSITTKKKKKRERERERGQKPLKL
jgi:hypothetical protein